MLKRVIHLKITYMTDKKLLDLGMFTQVVHQLTALNSFVDKVWLPPPTVVKDKPALLMKFQLISWLCLF